MKLRKAIKKDKEIGGNEPGKLAGKLIKEFTVTCCPDYPDSVQDMKKATKLECGRIKKLSSLFSMGETSRRHYKIRL